MPRKGENIRKRKDGRWEGRYKNINKIFSIYGKTYTEVKLKLLEAKASLIYDDEKQIRILFSDVFDEWLEGKKSTLKPSSSIKYETTINTHIYPLIKDVYINDVSNQFFKDFFKKLSESSPSLSNSLLKTIIYICKAVISFSNEKYSINNRISYKINSKNSREMVLLEKNDAIIIINTIVQSKYEKSLGILFSLCCGLRIGEVCALQWSDIDLKNGSIHITKTVQRIKNSDYKDDTCTKTRLLIGTPKSLSSIRVVPLPEYLKNFLQQYNNHKDSDYVISGSDKIIEPRNYQNYFRSFLKENNIEKVNYHILRHTFATLSISAGFDAKSLSEILGHSTVNITLDRYVHPSIEQKRNQMRNSFFKGQFLSFI